MQLTFQYFGISYQGLVIFLNSKLITLERHAVLIRFFSREMNIFHTNLNSFKIGLKVFSSNTFLIVNLKTTNTTTERYCDVCGL